MLNGVNTIVFMFVLSRLGYHKDTKCNFHPNQIDIFECSQITDRFQSNIISLSVRDFLCFFDSLNQCISLAIWSLQDENVFESN